MSDSDNKPDTKTETPTDTSTQEDTGTHADSHADDAAQDEGKKSTEGFSAEYVKKLREENKQARLKAKEAEKAAGDAKKQLDEIEAKNLANFNKLHKTFEKRIINAELQNAAVKEGLIDIDAFKMADLSSVKLSENGEVEGLAKVVADLKASKPYLFKVASNTNQKDKDPPADFVPKEKPTYETRQDFEKAKKDFFARLKKS